MRDLDPELMERAGELNIVVPGTWGNKRIQQAIDEASPKVEGADVIDEPVSQPAEPIRNTAEAVDKYQTVEWASERASKIFAGQSPHLPMVERIGRIRIALKERGFTRWNDLVITGAVDYQKYL